MTSDALAASRPMTRCPGGAVNDPRAIVMSTIAGCDSGTATPLPMPVPPMTNCVRKSNGTGWFGAMGAPFAVDAPAPASKKTSWPFCLAMRA